MLNQARIFTHRDCLLHESFEPGDHCPEQPERLRAVMDGIREKLQGKVMITGADSVPSKALARVHSPEFIERFEAACFSGKSYFMSSDNSICFESLEAAQSAAGQCHALGQHMLGGGYGFAAVRPPGHHASRDKAEGFCFFNNAAVCAETLLEKTPGGRVLIVDIDVHHGNGTQHVFCRRNDVFTLSLHVPQDVYPYSGAESERGFELGEGFNRNKVLPHGCCGDDWLVALRESLAEVEEIFFPDFVLLLAGFDGHKEDPMQLMQLEDVDYLAAGAIVRDFARRNSRSGHVGVILEGGYNPEVLKRLVPDFLAEIFLA